MAFSKYETRFNIEPHNQPGNRAKKLYKAMLRSGKPPDEFMLSRTNYTQRTASPFIPGDNEIIDNANMGEPNTKWAWDYGKQSAYFSGVSEKSITTLEEALEFCKADLNEWTVEKWGFKAYDVAMKVKQVENIDGKNHVVQVPIKRTCYNVYVKLVPKDKSEEEFAGMLDNIRAGIRAMSVNTVTKNVSGTGILCLADIHLGAEVSELIKTPDFSIGKVVEHFNRIADEVNRMKYSSVYVNFVGDFFESISGLNHLNTFKSLARNGYGANIIKMGAEILGEFLRKINNLKGIYVIGGNHDRMTPSHDIDNEGSALDVVTYVMQLMFPNLDIEFHPYLMAKELDGICYVLTHGNFGIDRKDPAKIIYQYGNPNMYTVWLSGHLHSRTTKRVFHAQKTKVYNSIEMVSMDELNYRKIILPPVFTGNYYSETLGYLSTGGFVLIENNGRGKPIVIDHPL